MWKIRRQKLGLVRHAADLSVTGVFLSAALALFKCHWVDGGEHIVAARNVALDIAAAEELGFKIGILVKSHEFGARFLVDYRLHTAAVLRQKI